MGKGSDVLSSSQDLPSPPVLKATSLISRGARGQLKGQSLLWKQLMHVAVALGPLTESSLGSHMRGCWLSVGRQLNRHSALSPCDGHTDPQPRSLKAWLPYVCIPPSTWIHVLRSSSRPPTLSPSPHVDTRLWLRQEDLS